MGKASRRKKMRKAKESQKKGKVLVLRNGEFVLEERNDGEVVWVNPNPPKPMTLKDLIEFAAELENHPAVQNLKGLHQPPIIGAE